MWNISTWSDARAVLSVWVHTEWQNCGYGDIAPVLIIINTPNGFKDQQSRTLEVEACMMGFNSSNEKWMFCYFLIIYDFFYIFFQPRQNTSSIWVWIWGTQTFSHIENKIWWLWKAVVLWRMHLTFWCMETAHFGRISVRRNAACFSAGLFATQTLACEFFQCLWGMGPAQSTHSGLFQIMPLQDYQLPF